MDTPVAWSDEARRRVEHAPPFVRPGILKLTERRARERGRAVITSEFLTEIRNESMLRVAKAKKFQRYLAMIPERGLPIVDRALYDAALA